MAPAAKGIVMGLFSDQVAEGRPRDVTSIAVGKDGGVRRCVELPGVQLFGPTGTVVVPVAEFLLGLHAGDASPATVHSYALALLRWWRFLSAVGVDWDRAERVDVCDFVLWMRLAPRAATAGSTEKRARAGVPAAGYAPATINHNLAVLRSFYDERLAAGQGPVLNPVPIAQSRGGQRLDEHHNPMQSFESHRRGPLRQRTAAAIPRAIPDRAFDVLFASMNCDRDRALLAFYVSTGARASELLGATVDKVDVSRQVIGVHRKGSGALQWLPASADAFVWLRLHQQRQLRDEGERALWLTRRSPVRPLSYPAMRRVLQRANDRVGTGWTLHDLRHTAAHRMIADPALSLTDVQWVLGHAHLSTTQIYLHAAEAEVIGRVVEHHRERAQAPPPAPPVGRYRPEVLDTLLGAAAHGG